MARKLLALTSVLFALSVSVVFGQQNLGRPLESKGFVIYSPDRETRSRLARLAQSASGEWEKLTGEKASTASPIVIVDKTRGAKPRGAKGAQCA